MLGMSGEEAQRLRAVILPGYQEAFRIIFLIMAALAALAFVIAFLMMPQVELSRPDDEKFRSKDSTDSEQVGTNDKA